MPSMRPGLLHPGCLRLDADNTIVNILAFNEAGAFTPRMPLPQDRLRQEESNAGFNEAGAFTPRMPTPDADIPATITAEQAAASMRPGLLHPGC